MAVYVVTVYKQNSLFNIGEFGNTYHVNAATATEAINQGQTVMTLESAIMSDTTTFTRIEAILPGVRGGGGRLDVFGNVGERTAVGAILPPWNVARVSWKPALSSKRLRKYLRIGLGEGDVNGQLLEAAIVTLLDTYNDGIVDDTNVCAPDGGILDTGANTVYGYISMRQTDHNRSHRPGFHRGWVPD